MDTSREDAALRWAAARATQLPGRLCVHPQPTPAQQSKAQPLDVAYLQTSPSRVSPGSWVARAAAQRSAASSLEVSIRNRAKKPYSRRTRTSGCVFN